MSEAVTSNGRSVDVLPLENDRTAIVLPARIVSSLNDPSMYGPVPAYVTIKPWVGAGISVVTRRVLELPLFVGIEKVKPVIEAVGVAAGGGGAGGGAAGGGATTVVAISVRVVFAEAVPVLPVRVAVDCALTEVVLTANVALD